MTKIQDTNRLRGKKPTQLAIFHLIHRRDRLPTRCAVIGQYPNAEHEPTEHDDCVIFTESAGGMVDIHDRRPMMLSPDLALEWIDPAAPKERAEQMVMLQGEPTEAFEWFKVDVAVGNARSEGPNLIAPRP